MIRHLTRRAVAATAALATAAGLLALAAAPSASAPPQAPGSFTGYAFDTCTAPTQAQMDAWWRSSRYGAVGIYVSGSSRGCAQPQLTRSWVTLQARRGWRLLPIHVGRQAPCYTGSKKRMSSNATRARAQGVAEAKQSSAAARALGITQGVLYLDIEWYPRSNTTCDLAVRAFVNGWTSRLERTRHRSGLYSSGSAAIALMNDLKNAGRRYPYPDHLWIGWYNNRASLDGGPYLDDDVWRNARIHQYVGNVTERNGGVAIHIDRNVLRVGRGSTPTRARAQCGTVNVRGFAALSPRTRRSPMVSVAKCLLRQRGYYRSRNDSPIYGSGVRRAVRTFRVRHGWASMAVMNPTVWTALLSDGSSPVLKEGSTGQRVYRLQRSLTAALGRPVARTGHFDRHTTQAVVAYRRAVGLPGWPTAEPRLWAALRAGKR